MDKDIEELSNRIDLMEKEKKLAELKERLKRLENKEEKPREERISDNRITGNPLIYKPLEQNLEEGMKGLGGQIGGMPHIIIPTSGEIKDLKSPSEQQPTLLTEKEQKIAKNVKKWGIIIAVLIVVGYALYRAFKGWIL